MLWYAPIIWLDFNSTSLYTSRYGCCLWFLCQLSFWPSIFNSTKWLSKYDTQCPSTKLRVWGGFHFIGACGRLHWCWWHQKLVTNIKCLQHPSLTPMLSDEILKSIMIYLFHFIRCSSSFSIWAGWKSLNSWLILLEMTMMILIWIWSLIEI